MILIADSTPLIVLARIGRLGILHGLTAKVLIPPAVHREILVRGAKKPGSQAIRRATWIERTGLREPPAFDFPPQLGAGECEAIALAHERELPLLTDDAAARRFAEHQGVRVTRTLALLLLAEEEAVIDDAGVVAHELVRAGFRLHPSILGAFLAQLEASRLRRGTRRLAA